MMPLETPSVNWDGAGVDTTWWKGMDESRQCILATVKYYNRYVIIILVVML